MRQSTILINAAFIIAKMVFNIINERNQSPAQTGQKSLTDSASGILLGSGRWHSKFLQRRQRIDLQTTGYRNESQHKIDAKTISVVGDYAYVNSGHSLLIFNISSQSNPVMVSETLF